MTTQRPSRRPLPTSEVLHITIENLKTQFQFRTIPQRSVGAPTMNPRAQLWWRTSPL